MIKTYIVTLPEKSTLPYPAGTLAIVDATLRAFQVAIRAVSPTHRWWNLNIATDYQTRYFDTDCNVAVSALRDELSNIGVQVKPETVKYDCEHEYNIGADVCFKCGWDSTE